MFYLPFAFNCLVISSSCFILAMVQRISSFSMLYLEDILHPHLHLNSKFVHTIWVYITHKDSSNKGIQGQVDVGIQRLGTVDQGYASVNKEFSGEDDIIRWWPGAAPGPPCLVESAKYSTSLLMVVGALLCLSRPGWVFSALFVWRVLLWVRGVRLGVGEGYWKCGGGGVYLSWIV